LGLVLSPPVQILTETHVALGMRRSENGEPEVKAASTDSTGDTSEDNTDDTLNDPTDAGSIDNTDDTLDDRTEHALTNVASPDTKSVDAPPATPQPVTVPVWATALAASLSFLAGIGLTLAVGLFIIRRAKSKTYVFGPDNTAPLVKTLLV